MTRKPAPCGFCMTKHHDRCAGTIVNGNKGVWRCPCTATDNCGLNRCTYCGWRGDDVADTSVCLDRVACDTRVQVSRENAVPGVKLMHEIIDRAAESSPPRKKRNKTMAAAKTDVKGTAWLTEQVAAKLGTTVEGKQVRTILRKLASSGEIEREDGRWSFTGVNDPAVKAVVAAIKGGALEAKPRGRKAAEPATDEAKPARRARKPKTEAVEEAKPARRTRKAAAKPVVEDDDDLDLEEL